MMRAVEVSSPACAWEPAPGLPASHKRVSVHSRAAGRVITGGTRSRIFSEGDENRAACGLLGVGFYGSIALEAQGARRRPASLDATSAPVQEGVSMSRTPCVCQDTVFSHRCLSALSRGRPSRQRAGCDALFFTREIAMARVNRFPYWVGGFMTAAQKEKLQRLAAAGNWTRGQVLRLLVDAAELSPPQMRVTVRVPEPRPPADA